MISSKEIDGVCILKACRPSITFDISPHVFLSGSAFVNLYGQKKERGSIRLRSERIRNNPLPYDGFYEM